MRKLQKAGALVLCFCFWTPGQPIQAGGVGFATEFTQFANYLQLAGQTLKLTQQIQQLASQLQWMVYNSKNITSHPLTAIQGDLMALSTAVQESQGLAYSLGNLDHQFAALYPSYDPHDQWSDTYLQWSSNTLKTLNGTLKSIGLQGQDLQSEQQVLSQIRSLSSSDLGQNQAMQVGNLVAQEMVSQLVKLRQLQLTDMQTKSAFAGYQMQQQNASQQSSQQAFTPQQWDADQRGW